jgi:hypothetical protein
MGNPAQEWIFPMSKRITRLEDARAMKAKGKPLKKPISLDGVWSDHRCIGCDRNTSPGTPPQERAEIILNRDGQILVTYTKKSEVYFVHESVWKKAGMRPWGGCLCIECLETRLGRRLKPIDFAAHDFNSFPGTPRLINCRGNVPTAAIVRTWITLDDLRDAAKKPDEQ